MGSNDVDEFLSHSGSESRGGRLKNWKKDPGHIDVWMHTARTPRPLWKHGFHKIEARENKKTRETEKQIWGHDFICWEEESVLKKQYRLDEDGHRELPPVSCPMCLCIDWVREQVLAKKLKWTQPLFVFEGDEDDEGRPRKTVITTGGFYNGFKDVEVGSDEFEELKKAKIFLRDAWRQNGLAKLNYVFAVVDNGNVADGMKIAIETGLLGDRVKQVIRKARESLGDEEGNPFVNPFAIRWKFNEKAIKFDEKYDALRMEKIQMNDQIEKLIVDGPPPSLARVLEKGDPKTLRALFERHAKIDLPLDKFFKAKAPKSEDDSTDFNPEELEKKERTPEVETKPEKEAEVPAGRRRKKKEEEPKPEPKKQEMIGCDDCGELMPANAKECKKCGAEYDVDSEESPNPEPEEKPKKGGKKAAKADADDADADDDAF